MSLHSPAARPCTSTQATRSEPLIKTPGLRAPYLSYNPPSLPKMAQDRHPPPFHSTPDPHVAFPTLVRQEEISHGKLLNSFFLSPSTQRSGEHRSAAASLFRSLGRGGAAGSRRHGGNFMITPLEGRRLAASSTANSNLSRLSTAGLQEEVTDVRCFDCRTAGK